MLIAGATLLAYVVISNDDGSSPDLVVDFAGGIEAPNLFGPIVIVIPLMAFVIGASSIGADLRTGMVEQILTWEPRRSRFLLARFFANFTWACLATSLVAAGFSLLMLALTALTGSTSGADSEFWLNVGVGVVRMGIVGGVFATLGVGAAVMAESTIGAIVGFVVYFVIVESLVNEFVPRAADFLLLGNLGAFVAGTGVDRGRGDVLNERLEVVVSHGFVAAGLLLFAWPALLGASSSLVFRRRDIV